MSEVIVREALILFSATCGILTAPQDMIFYHDSTRAHITSDLQNSVH